jgi:hypothetical protein
MVHSRKFYLLVVTCLHLNDNRATPFLFWNKIPLAAVDFMDYGSISGSENLPYRKEFSRKLLTFSGAVPRSNSKI